MICDSCYDYWSLLQLLQLSCRMGVTVTTKAFIQKVINYMFWHVTIVVNIREHLKQMYRQHHNQFITALVSYGQATFTIVICGGKKRFSLSVFML